jgi:hypothetical protein
MEGFNDSSIMHWDHEPSSPHPAFGHPLPMGWGEGNNIWSGVPGAALRLPRATIFSPSGAIEFGSLRSHAEEGQRERFMGSGRCFLYLLR